MQPPPPNKPSAHLRQNWLPDRFRTGLLIWGLPLATTALLAWQSWIKATEFDYRVQEDARQHVFWMLRYLTRSAFPDDPIADYFQSVAPWLYRGIYAASWRLLGLEPKTLVLILPPLLGLVAVGFSVALGRQLSSRPLVAGLAGVLCAQTLWMEDDLASATPRAFATPLLLVFLYCLSRRQAWGCGLAIAAQAGLYPPAALMAWVTVCLRVGDRRHWPLWGAATLGLGLGLLPLLLAPQPFGDSITRQAAASMVEFQAIGDDYGRAFFFHDNPLIFWGFGVRSGLLFWGLMAPLNLTALAWPWIRPNQSAAQNSTAAMDYPAHSGSTQRTSDLAKTVRVLDFAIAPPQRRNPQASLSNDRLLGHFALSILLCYCLAHVALFHLHFPGRYPYHGFRTLLPIAAAVVWAELIRRQRHRWQTHVHWCHRLGILALAGFQVGLLLLPFYPDLSVENQLYTTGKAEALYEFLQDTPPETLVATLDKEGNNVPYYAGRATLVSQEYALPYHPDYYAILQQRAKDFLAAYATPDPDPIIRLLERYPVTYFIFREGGFTADYLWEKIWLRPFQPELDRAILQLETHAEQGTSPLLQSLLPVCTVLQTRDLYLLEAACVRDRVATQ